MLVLFSLSLYFNFPWCALSFLLFRCSPYVIDLTNPFFFWLFVVVDVEMSEELRMKRLLLMRLARIGGKRSQEEVERMQMKKLQEAQERRGRLLKLASMNNKLKTSKHATLPKLKRTEEGEIQEVSDSRSPSPPGPGADQLQGWEKERDKNREREKEKETEREKERDRGEKEKEKDKKKKRSLFVRKGRVSTNVRKNDFVEKELLAALERQQEQVLERELSIKLKAIEREKYSPSPPFSPVHSPPATSPRALSPTLSPSSPVLSPQDTPIHTPSQTPSSHVSPTETPSETPSSLAFSLPETPSETPSSLVSPAETLKDTPPSPLLSPRQPRAVDELSTLAGATITTTSTAQTVDTKPRSTTLIGTRASSLIKTDRRPSGPEDQFLFEDESGPSPASREKRKSSLQVGSPDEDTAGSLSSSSADSSPSPVSPGWRYAAFRPPQAKRTSNSNEGSAEKLG